MTVAVELEDLEYKADKYFKRRMAIWQGMYDSSSLANHKRLLKLAIHMFNILKLIKPQPV